MSLFIAYKVKGWLYDLCVGESYIWRVYIMMSGKFIGTPLHLKFVTPPAKLL